MTEDDVVRLYQEEIRLGEATRSFLRSPLGEYLVGRAQIEMDEAKDRLVRINPHSWFSRRSYARVKAEYEVAHQFLRWLNDAIVNGDAALTQLESLDENE
jgi:hypothetical protein